VRVVLSSGYNQQDVTQRFAGKRLAGFIQKPYSLKQLRRTLQRVIEDAEPFQEEIADPPV
jgi:two-component system, cell cycle sensor histidine kinase and response regulator CckA